jgi:pyrimidine-nucleoside phosphorylase
MVEVGTRMGRRMAAVLTDMNQPLGRTAGNAVEIIETIDSLRGDGPDDLMRVTMELSAWMLMLTNRAPSRDEALAQLDNALGSGRALETFAQMVTLQGGDASIVETPDALAIGDVVREIPAPCGGAVSAVDAEGIGRACILLGAGRRQVSDDVDHAVGVTDIRKIGEAVGAGDLLARIHASSEQGLDEAAEMVSGSFKIDDRATAPDLIVETITEGGRS